MRGNRVGRAMAALVVGATALVGSACSSSVGSEECLTAGGSSVCLRVDGSALRFDAEGLEPGSVLQVSEAELGTSAHPVGDDGELEAQSALISTGPRTWDLSVTAVASDGSPIEGEMVLRAP